MEASKESLITQLIVAGCYKTGDFVLRSGDRSHYYVDLRRATMYPKLFKKIVTLIKDYIEVVKDEQNKASQVAIAGVPYGVVPFASAVAYECNLAYYPVRKEKKYYGCQLDSSDFENYKFILVEDVMSSGSSIVETINKMDAKKITDVVVIVDRESGGEDNLRSLYPNIRLHSLLKLSEIFSVDKKL